MDPRHEWAIVLAAGEGTRLALTDERGTRVPKQFWSLQGERSLLGDALHRAWRVVAPQRTLVVVDERHRTYWEPELAGLPRENVIVQPTNRGTAAGLLLPLLAVLERDAEARVLILPSDHYVRREAVLSMSLRLALESLGARCDRVVLLGIHPDTADTSYGWILPRSRRGTLEPVAAFVEKPEAVVAARLMAEGGVWNSFLLVASARSLQELYVHRLPELNADLAAARQDGAEALARLYSSLDAHDFSRDLLQESPDHLRLLRVDPCGWTDLGTPDRLRACLDRVSKRHPAGPRRRPRFRFADALGRLRDGSRSWLTPGPALLSGGRP